ncbi:lamin tail domain-containing protein [Paenibacillus alkalitolerans]|uniref:lamin tail domain-containing protein n=1 Tax=Paenibacillus alkalitolerans TaxID=2799335 RepID=UPI002D80679B|nr:lamin tail domain-containing protein [Paenibacillus alkalitolerans]
MEGGIRIAGAIVIPEGDGNETVTLLNASNRDVDLTGWAIANKVKQRYKLQGFIQPGQFMSIPIIGQSSGFLRNKGDIITLLDQRGLKVDGVSYTKHQVKPGWTVLF